MQPGTPQTLRAINENAALRLLLEHGPLSRTSLSRLSKLSKPTASQLLTRLQSVGLVIAAGYDASRFGPNAQLYTINPNIAYVAGVDVTPTHIGAAIADFTGRVITESTLRVSPCSADDAFRVIHRALEITTTEANITVNQLDRVAIGLQGAVSQPEGRVSHAEYLAGWHRPHVVEDLALHLGVPVCMENDVNLVALAEARRKGIDSANFAMLWLGDGVKVSTVIEGKLLRGVNGAAGEIGYLPVPGEALARDFKPDATRGSVQVSLGHEALLELARSHRLSAPDAAAVVSMAVSAGKRGERFLTELATRAAAALTTVVSVIDPPLIVMAGDIAVAGGPELCRRIGDELGRMTAIPRAVQLTTVQDNAVLEGAIFTALRVARDGVFHSAASPSNGAVND